jgi:methyltransferase (TIGR00027 family)
MGETNISRSAVGVLLVRAYLTSLGVVDDPLARQMLPPKARRVLAWLQLPGLWRLARRSSNPYLATRTLFFDQFVGEAMDDGVRQVVVLAAGYDSRAWRMARPGVTFFEVDRPATQADKRTRAPAGGPRYVPADVTDPGLMEMLANAGLRADEPIAFVVEGLTVYMAQGDVADLFAGLSEFASPGSRLAVSFESGFQRQPFMRRVMTAYYRRSGETYRFRLRAEDAPAFMSAAGWTVDDVLTPARLAAAFLADTKLAGVKIDTPSFLLIGKK